MSTAQQKFYDQADIVASDLKHRATLNYNISKYDDAVVLGKARYANLEEAKQQASSIKSMSIDNMAELLTIFESNVLSNGGEVFWANKSQDVLDILQPILEECHAKMIVKSKSMVSEEIELNHFLEQNGVQSLETDLGEFIVQLAGEKPYHIVTPAMHKSKDDVAKLFHTHFGTDLSLDATQLTAYVRDFLREKYTEADIGFTGANFLCAREGAVAVTENEGNAFLSTAFPKIHVVIAGIEKIIPSIDDLELFWPLLAAHGTGQQLTVYNNIFTGVKQAHEIDGPERFIVILLDNDRTKIHQDPVLRESLKCIRCGACLNGCPVYKNIGGYTYKTTYSGPIGSVISPVLNGYKQAGHLSFASTLCGKCEEVCPVKIPLTKLLVHNRQLATNEGIIGIKAKFINRIISLFLLRRSRMDMFGGWFKNKFLAIFQNRFIGQKRELNDFAKKSFSAQWSEKLKK